LAIPTEEPRAATWANVTYVSAPLNAPIKTDEGVDLNIWSMGSAYENLPLQDGRTSAQ
jgi:hypothetical protein